MKLTEFFFRTFTDPQGQPDAKLLTAFLCTVAFIVQMGYCTYKNQYPPEGVVLAELAFLAGLFGFAHREINTSITMDTQANIAHQANPNNINVDVKNPE